MKTLQLGGGPRSSRRVQVQRGCESLCFIARETEGRLREGVNSGGGIGHDTCSILCSPRGRVNHGMSFGVSENTEEREVEGC